MFKTEKNNLQLIIGDREVKCFILCSIIHRKSETASVCFKKIIFSNN